MEFMSRKFLSTSFFFWAGFAALGLYFIWPLRKHINFGIDLVGGTHVTLEVQTDKPVEDRLEERMRNLIQVFKKTGITLPKSKTVENLKIKMVFDNEIDLTNAYPVIQENYPEMTIRALGNDVLISFPVRAEEEIRHKAVARDVDVLNARLSNKGLSEISVTQHGDNRIVVELPDVENPQAAKQIIGRPAVLEIKPVIRSAPTEDELLDDYDGELPDEMEILRARPKAEGDLDSSGYYLVPKYTDVTGDLLVDANLSYNEGRPVVAFEFSREGGENFRTMTRENMGGSIAVVLDNEVISAPRINEEIGRQGIIKGSFTAKTARDLAVLLKSGAYAAPLTFEGDREVGASLGEESRYQGLLSCLIGLFLLLVFALFYYKVCGFFAFFALLYNLVLVLIGMATMRATLTLPGIAGLVLTVGMAIDASVLIYERIKEELAAGLPFKKALDAGFSDAMVVILDSNITTFIVAVVLYKFGTGPIQGFAVTMMLGIVATLITGIFFLRSIFHFFFSTFGVQRISI